MREEGNQAEHLMGGLGENLRNEPGLSGKSGWKTLTHKMSLIMQNFIDSTEEELGKSCWDCKET